MLGSGSPLAYSSGTTSRRINGLVPFTRLGTIAFEWISQFNPKLVEVTHVPGDHSQSVNDGCRRNHRVFGHSVRPPVHETCPLPEGGRVHRQYTVGSQDLVQPGFQLLCLGLILITGNLDPRLYLSNRNGRYEELLRRHIRDPIQNSAMWTGTAQLRNHIGIQEVQRPTPRPGVLGGDAVGAVV